MKLTNLIPMLNVSNLETSLKFYNTALQFEVVSPKEAIKEWRWAIIRSGDTEMMLAETGADIGLQKNVDPRKITNWPTIFYFYPDDVEALYESITSKGFVLSPLEVTFYGMKEFSLQDPDGHMLSFGQDAEPPKQ